MFGLRRHLVLVPSDVGNVGPMSSFDRIRHAPPLQRKECPHLLRSLIASTALPRKLPRLNGLSSFDSFSSLRATWETSRPAPLSHVKCGALRHGNSKSPHLVRRPLASRSPVSQASEAQWNRTNARPSQPHTTVSLRMRDLSPIKKLIGLVTHPGLCNPRLGLVQPVVRTS